MGNFVVGFSTTDSKEEAKRIARALVGERLAACVNIVPDISSIYSWENRLCDEKEILMIIKTVASKVEDLKTRLKELHHYECPELVFLPIENGLSEYLEWVKTNT